MCQNTRADASPHVFHPKVTSELQHQVPLHRLNGRPDATHQHIFAKKKARTWFSPPLVSLCLPLARLVELTRARRKRIRPPKRGGGRRIVPWFLVIFRASCLDCPDSDESPCCVSRPYLEVTYRSPTPLLACTIGVIRVM